MGGWKTAGRPGGQSVSEYAVVAIVVLASLLGMQTYVKRGLQARIKVSADDLLAISQNDLADPSPTKIGETTQARGMTSSVQTLEATGLPCAQTDVNGDGVIDTADTAGLLSLFTTTSDSQVVEGFDGASGVLTSHRFTQDPAQPGVVGPEVTTRTGCQQTRQFEVPPSGPPAPGPSPPQ